MHVVQGGDVDLVLAESEIVLPVRAVVYDAARAYKAREVDRRTGEIYVAGNGGIKTEVAQFFCKVTSDEEVLEYSAAFLQLYREEAFYLERTCHYLARVGLDSVKKVVLDDPVRRKELYERLLFALQNYEDPWSAAVQKPAVRREFELLEI